MLSSTRSRYVFHNWCFVGAKLNVSQTTIRVLGGLLSAYALSGEPILLARADDLGAMLLPAFNTTHGLPMYAVNTVSYVLSLSASESVRVSD